MAADYADRDHAVLDALTRLARPIILERFSADSCVASTRIGLDALDYFGVPAKALPASVSIFNAEARDIMNREGLAAMAAAVRETPANSDRGPWTVGLGMPVSDPTAQGAGHVVIAVPRHGLFVDLSLDQASRPHKRMILAASGFEIPPDQTAFFTEPGTRAAYTAHVDPDSDPVTLIYEHQRRHRYRQSPNWRRTGEHSGVREGFRATTAAVIEAIREDPRVALHLL